MYVYICTYVEIKTLERFYINKAICALKLSAVYHRGAKPIVYAVTDKTAWMFQFAVSGFKERAVHMGGRMWTTTVASEGKTLD